MIESMTSSLAPVALATIVALHVLGIRRLKRRYTSTTTPPDNTSLLRGQLGYIGSAFVSMGSCASGLYVSDLFFPQGLLIPWSKLGAPHRTGPLTWYWVREGHLPIVVRTSLVRQYPAEVSRAPAA